MNPLLAFERLLPWIVRRPLSRVRTRLEKIIGESRQPERAERTDTAHRTYEPPAAAASAPTDSSVSTPATPPGRKPRRKTAKSETNKTKSPTYSASELADYLGVTTATISNLRRDRKIYGYRANQRAYAYPKAQIIQGASKRPPRVIEGLDAVLARFDDTQAAWAWLTTSQDGIGTKSRPISTPLDELRRGRIKPVLGLLAQA